MEKRSGKWIIILGPGPNPDLYIGWYLNSPELVFFPSEEEGYVHLTTFIV